MYSSTTLTRRLSTEKTCDVAKKENNTTGMPHCNRGAYHWEVELVEHEILLTAAAYNLVPHGHGGHESVIAHESPTDGNGKSSRMSNGEVGEDPDEFTG